jgi:hypothetical protein
MKTVPLPIDCNGLNDVDKNRIGEIGLWVWMDERVALSPIGVGTSAHSEISSGRGNFFAGCLKPILAK